MSLAARRVKVSSRIRLACRPWVSRSHAARATSVRVLPVPAPARTSSAPPSCVAARPLLFVQPVQNVAMVEHAYEHNQAGWRISHAAPA